MILIFIDCLDNGYCQRWIYTWQQEATKKSARNFEVMSIAYTVPEYTKVTYQPVEFCSIK